MKAFFEEFKAFISRGNVLDLAVGVIIGGAFTAIVTSLVNDIITPLLGIILGGINFADLKVVIGGAELLYGNFIQSIITFLLTAFAVFCLVKSINKLQNLKKKEEEEAPAPEPEIPADIQLLTEIRDMLKTASEQNK